MICFYINFIITLMTNENGSLSIIKVIFSACLSGSNDNYFLVTLNGSIHHFLRVNLNYNDMVIQNIVNPI